MVVVGYYPFRVVVHVHLPLPPLFPESIGRSLSAHVLPPAQRAPPAPEVRAAIVPGTVTEIAQAVTPLDDTARFPAGTPGGAGSPASGGALVTGQSGSNCPGCSIRYRAGMGRSKSLTYFTENAADFSLRSDPRYLAYREAAARSSPI